MKRRPSLVALAEDYLTFRRGLGFAMRIEGAALLRFARYADAAGHRGPLTTDLALAWARLPKDADPLYWARRLDIVRRFAKYRALFDPTTEIPPDEMLGPSYRRSAPYIYSEGEIADLLRASRQLGPVDGLRPHTYVTLFGLLASTGLRISEALRLTREDVDLAAGLLTISQSKFHKSRLIPLHSTTTANLREYADRRDNYHPCLHLSAFFLTERGTALSYWQVRTTFTSLRRGLGWVGRGVSPPARRGTYFSEITGDQEPTWLCGLDYKTLVPVPSIPASLSESRRRARSRPKSAPVKGAQAGGAVDV
jgi:integrase